MAKLLLSSTEFADGKVVPALEHANGFLENIDDAICAVVKRVRSSVNAEPQVLIFIDGFDEVDLTEAERSVFIEQLIRIAAKERICIALLSRPFDDVSILGQKAHSIDVFRIDPLRGKKAIEFLEKTAGQLDVKSKLVSDLHNSPLLKALEGAPIAYILLGRLLAENQQDLPSNLTELFQKYCELVLGRWEIAKGLRSQQEYEVLVECLTWLATYMLENSLAEIAVSELKSWISAYCVERGISIDQDSLVSRVCGRNSILYYRSDIRVVGFRHRAFSEFFYARHLSKRPSIDLTPETFSPYWFNSYFFLAGIQRDCPDLLTSLLDLELKLDTEKLMRAMNFGNLLLAGYLTPTSISTAAVKKVARELSQLYVAACDPNYESTLSIFPTIQLLSAFTSMFREQYGYRHFKISLEEAIYEVESGDLSEESAITLFLLDTAYKASGGELRFDGLIDKFGESLPLVLKLAIGHESDRMKLMSDRVKKMERNIRRGFSVNSKKSSDFLHKLYKVPVKQLEKKLF